MARDRKNRSKNQLALVKKRQRTSRNLIPARRFQSVEMQKGIKRNLAFIVKTIRKDLMKNYPLVDEILVVDSGSEDRTKTITEKAGARFHYCSRTSQLPASEVPGKGSNLWVSLHLTTGDIVSWVDGDIRNFHSKFVYGPVGVLLENEGIKYVKGFYKRPLVGELYVPTYVMGQTKLEEIPLKDTAWPALINIPYYKAKRNLDKVETTSPV